MTENKIEFSQEGAVPEEYRMQKVGKALIANCKVDFLNFICDVIKKKTFDKKDRFHLYVYGDCLYASCGKEATVNAVIISDKSSYLSFGDIYAYSLIHDVDNKLDKYSIEIEKRFNIIIFSNEKQFFDMATAMNLNYEQVF